MESKSRIRLVKKCAKLSILALLAIFPLISSPYQNEILAKFIVFGMLALSYDLIWGYGGIINFGHAIFFGLGAYAFGLTLMYVHIPGVTYLAFFAAIVIPMLLGIFLAFFLLYGGVGGVYFGIVTLLLSGMFESIAIAATTVTGGMNGLYGFQSPKLGIPGIWEFRLSGVMVSYYLILIASLGSLWVTQRLMKTDFGRVVVSIRNNEERTEFLGYNVSLIKLIIFSISCGLAGLSGALYVPVALITPSLLGLGMSISILVWVAVGGRGTLVGPIVGALVVNYLQELLSGMLVKFWFLLVGLFFIAVVVFWPDGIMGLLTSRFSQPEEEE
jgi:urea transport system permease protein